MSQSDNKYAKYLVLPEHKIILCYFEGQIQIQDIISINSQLISDPLYTPDCDVLMDFRNCEALVFRIEILEFVNFFKKNIKVKGKVKSGIIINSMNAEFLFNTYKSFINLFNVEAQRFHDLDSCLLWFRPKENDFTEIKEALVSIKPKKPTRPEFLINPCVTFVTPH